ncbi:hypothetical protein [Actinomadura sp. WAC 06369]|uniref:hypothetical protein n=1 Tax=Actinomadura sp. WAC 06369 TaxID=2203193 RepID=UPI000F7A9A4A|nr:hypothetical protein [Actinomadura sp. WAC 06369]RSN40485.1 hypothetical protein DMH08_39405 [Actinomadura sp. WAC 06369]
MNTNAKALLGRLHEINWQDAGAMAVEHEKSRVQLLLEYLRRAAIWGREIGPLTDERAALLESLGISAHSWPFYDFAAMMNPSVRATAEQLDHLRTAIPYTFGSPTLHACENALHLATLKDQGLQQGELPDPFEPLILLFERGGGFTVDGTGFINLHPVSIKQGKPSDHLSSTPVAPMDKSGLDELDGIIAGEPRLQIARTWDSFEPDGTPGVDRPPIAPPEREPLVRYLEHAHVVVSSRRKDPDLLDPSRAPHVPRTYHTDGTWIWPGEVGYYLDVHSVPPQPELVEHARGQDFRIPDLDERTRARVLAAIAKHKDAQR